MEFLVHITITLPRDMPEAERALLLDAEHARGQELRGEGTISRIWRIPGRYANVGVWQAVDATQLHDALTSLPLFEFLDITVTPLAKHRLEANA